MAQYTIAHSCNHITTQQLYGKGIERTRRIEWLQEQPCLTCKRAQEQQQAQAAGLPALTGTKKQIAWAERIRLDALAAVRRLLDEHRADGERAVAAGQIAPEKVAVVMADLEPLYVRLAGQTAAAWWIDHRGEGAQSLMRAMMAVSA